MKLPTVLYETTCTVSGTERADAWAAALDHMRLELLERWELTEDPQPTSPWAGCESLVLPVLTKERYQAVLRFAAPNADNPRVHRQVLTALQAWGGHGAVRVIREDSSFRATLQERLKTADNLSIEPLENVPPIWGQLSRALRVPGPAGLVRVQDIAAKWLSTFPSDVRLLEGLPEFAQDDWAVVNGARMWIERLAQSPESWLLHADLHYYNILAGHPDSRGVASWKAIDPQPVVGPAAYSLAPLLWNRLVEIPAAEPEAQAAWLRGFAAEVCACADIDPAFGLGASAAREVENMFWYLRSAEQGSEKALGDAARSLWVARALTGVSVRGASAHDLKPLG